MKPSDKKMKDIIAGFVNTKYMHIFVPLQCQEIFLHFELPVRIAQGLHFSRPRDKGKEGYCWGRRQYGQMVI